MLEAANKMHKSSSTLQQQMANAVKTTKEETHTMWTLYQEGWVGEWPEGVDCSSHWVNWSQQSSAREQLNIQSVKAKIREREQCKSATKCSNNNDDKLVQHLSEYLRKGQLRLSILRIKCILDTSTCFTGYCSSWKHALASHFRLHC